MEPRFASTVTGNLLARASLLRFIRSFWQASGQKSGYALEFGVLNGQSMIETWGSLRGLVTHMFGFDSFTGLPALSPADRDALPLMPDFHEGNFRAMAADAVREGILANAHGLAGDQLTLVEGDFAETLPAFDRGQLGGLGPCLLAHVDCDLHSSSSTVFRLLDEVATTGTWVLLDDYWTYRGSPRHGQRRAFEEWINASRRVGATEYGNYNGFCKAFVVYEL